MAAEEMSAGTPLTDKELEGIVGGVGQAGAMEAAQKADIDVVAEPEPVNPSAEIPTRELTEQELGDIRPGVVPPNVPTNPQL